MYDIKGSKTNYVIRKDLSKNYEVEVDASEAPILNKLLNDPEPYESSMADLKILEEEVFPINNSIKNIFKNDLDLKSIKLAIGGSKNDYVTIEEGDLIKYGVKPTLNGLVDFYNDNKDSILGFLDCEYITEQGNVIYLDCEKKKLSDNITSIKVKILASMQQRGFFLQQEHKYYGLQLYIIIESKVPDDDKLFKLMKELEIDWELIFFRRKLAIHDWTEIECEKNPENLQNYLQSKYEKLNFYDNKNIKNLVVNNKLPFIAADKMASLLNKLKTERASQYQNEYQRQYQAEKSRRFKLGEELSKLEYQRKNLRKKQQQYPTEENSKQLKTIETEILEIEKQKRSLFENLTELSKKIQKPEGTFEVSLLKAEIIASAKLACAYLGLSQKIIFDDKISISEIIKYQEELTNI